MTWGDGAAIRLAPNVRNDVIDLLDDWHDASVGVGPWYPSEANPEAPQIPYLAVANDGTIGSNGAQDQVVIRITAWGDNPTPTWDLAASSRGRLLAFQGNGQINSIRRGTGIVDDVDDRTGHNLATFTVIVAARPTAAQ